MLSTCTHMATVGVKGLSDSYGVSRRDGWQAACVIASNYTLSNLANFTSPMRTGFLTLQAAKAGGGIAVAMKSFEFLSQCGCAESFGSQSS